MRGTGTLWILFVAGFSCCFAQERGAKLDTMRIDVSAVRWTDPADTTRTHTAVLAGDPDSASYYTVRVLIPRGLRLMPHFHPDSRMVTVISGTLWIGYGTTFDQSRMKQLSPGGFFTEPAGQPHFAWAKDGDVVVQATGFGPSKTTFVTADSAAQSGR